RSLRQADRASVGTDFAFSSKFTSHLLAKKAKTKNGHSRSLASIAVDAACDGFEICQAHVGERRYPSADWMNQSSVLSQILHSVFHETDVRAACWQRIRGSQPVPTFGDRHTERQPAENFDVRRMIESFQLGYRNLVEIWTTVLPPGTLLELSKLARL